MNRTSRYLTAIALTAHTSFATSGIMIAVDEVGLDVVQSFSGSINLAALTLDSNLSNTSGIIPSGATIGFAQSPAVVYSLDFISSAGNSWGPGGIAGADFEDGDGFFFGAISSRLSLSTGYVSESSIQGSATFLNEDLASLGLLPGVYEYTFGQVGAVNDFVTVNIGQASVPGPATLALMGLGFLGLTLRRKT